MTQPSLKPIITTDREELIELLLEFWIQGRVPADMIQLDVELGAVGVVYGYC